MRTLKVLALTLVSGFALAACGASVPADDVEAQISSSLEEQVGVKPETVVCKDDLKAKVGEEITCQLTVDGGVEFDVTATVSEIKDNVALFDVKVADEPN